MAIERSAPAADDRNGVGDLRGSVGDLKGSVGLTPTYSSSAASLESSPLRVQIEETPVHVVGRWEGQATPRSLQTARDAAGRLRTASREHLVLELARLAFVADEVVSVLVELIVAAQRAGSTVTLVRCPAALHTRLREAGMSGGVWHSVSLTAATAGLVCDSDSALELHVRSDLELLPRVCVVAAALAREAGLRGAAWESLVVSIREAVTNAMTHGSPHGNRNDVRLAVHLGGRSLIVEVADQGPGFDLAMVQADGGMARIREGVDAVEALRMPHGMLLRLTRRLASPSGGLPA
jgi:anti-sigma regulatory factor (Ser/Thr protein kinase)